MAYFGELCWGKEGAGLVKGGGGEMEVKFGQTTGLHNSANESRDVPCLYTVYTYYISCLSKFNIQYSVTYNVTSNEFIAGNR